MHCSCLILFCLLSFFTTGNALTKNGFRKAYQLRVSNVQTRHQQGIQREIGLHREISQTLFMSSSTEADVGDDSEQLASPRRLSYATLWVGLLVYAFGFSPGGSAAASAIDTELIMKMISTPFDGTINPIFVSLFNFLGVLPAVYASLLLPGSKDQKIPALPFVMGSFALGFFGVGPYLCLRKLKTSVSSSERGRGSILFEFKGTSIALLGFSMFLAYYALSGVVSDGSCLGDFIDLFKTQRLVHVSTIDFTILSLAMWDPLQEDMKRRGWQETHSKAAIVSALPVIGPVSYLLFRNSLPIDDQKLS